MSIKRATTGKYSVIPNEIIRSEDLSLKAIAVLSVLLSLEDNWNFSESEFYKRFKKDSQSSVKKALLELEKVGYLRRTKRIGKNGKVYYSDWIVFQSKKDFAAEEGTVEGLLSIAPFYLENIDIESIRTTIATDSEFSNKLLNMNYYDFLQTFYWQNIATYLKKERKVCERCGKTKRLQVHHKTYKHHGLEHTQEVMDNDLVVLCRDCHKREHKIGG